MQFRLSQRFLALSVGDQIEFAGGQPAGFWRTESIEDGLSRRLKLRAVATYPDQVALGSEPAPGAIDVPEFGAPAFEVMNLPIGASDPEPRVHVAVAAVPWARRYAVWSSPDDFGFALRGVVTAPAVLGALVGDLPAGPIGRWDYANELVVRLILGEFAGLPDLLVLNGDNAAAVRCQNGEWEILQFAEAELLADGTWRLRKLLRAQLGTDPAMLSGSPAGSAFVLLDDAVTRIGLTQLESGLQLNWRAGPSSVPATGSATTEVVEEHAALQLRPLSPAHLRAIRNASCDVTLSWIRRSRIEADSWDAPETPLGETSERYRVEIFSGAGAALRSIDATSASLLYSAADQVADFAALPSSFAWSVVQIASNGSAGALRFGQLEA